MKIKAVMKKNLISMDGERKVIDACKLMGKEHIGSILVTLKNRPYGIFTERDLLSKILVKESDIRKVKIKNYASRPIVTVDENYSIHECARIMTDMKIKHLIVMSRGRITGIFTASDLARVISQSPLEF